MRRTFPQPRRSLHAKVEVFSDSGDGVFFNFESNLLRNCILRPPSSPFTRVQDLEQIDREIQKMYWEDRPISADQLWDRFRLFPAMKNRSIFIIDPPEEGSIDVHW